MSLDATADHVLLALGRDTLHGCAIMRSSGEMANGAAPLLPGTLHATLARMVEEGTR